MSYCRKTQGCDFRLSRIQVGPKQVDVAYECSDEAQHRARFETPTELLAHASVHVAEGRAIPIEALDAIKARIELEKKPQVQENEGP